MHVQKVNEGTIREFSASEIESASESLDLGTESPATPESPARKAGVSGPGRGNYNAGSKIEANYS